MQANLCSGTVFLLDTECYITYTGAFITALETATDLLILLGLSFGLSSVSSLLPCSIFLCFFCCSRFPLLRLFFLSLCVYGLAVEAHFLRHDVAPVSTLPSTALILSASEMQGSVYIQQLLD